MHTILGVLCWMNERYARMWWFPLSIPKWSNNPVLNHKFVVDNLEVKAIGNLESYFVFPSMYISCMWNIKYKSYHVAIRVLIYYLFLECCSEPTLAVLCKKCKFVIDNPKVKIMLTTWNGFLSNMYISDTWCALL